MQEADRGGTRIRLRRTRQGAAPWGTFKFFYRERGGSTTLLLVGRG